MEANFTMDTNEDPDILFQELCQDLCVDDEEFHSDGCNGWLSQSRCATTDETFGFLASALSVSEDFYRPLGLDNYLENELDCDDSDEEGIQRERKRKRKEGNITDANIVAEATEENLKHLNIDLNSKEGRMQRRKIRNRMSAQLHRERKAKYIEMLEGMVRERNKKIIELQSSLRKLYLDYERLKGQLNILAPNLDSTGEDTFINGKLPVAELPVQDKKEPTTDHYYESDTSCSGSNSSPSTSPIHVPSFYRSGLSMFSFLMMLGITIFTSDPTSSMPGNPTMQTPEFQGFSGETASHAHIPKLPYLALNIDTASFPGQFPALARNHYPLPDTTSAVDHNSVTGNGRVLLDRPLSLPSPVTTQIQRFSLPRIPNPTTTSSPSSRSTALWKYDNRVVQLFPHMIKDEVHGVTPPVTTRTQNLRGSIRSVHSQKSQRNEMIQHFGVEEGQVESSSKDRALVVASPALTWTDQKIDTDVLVQQAGSSRVLMTHGRALLDHSLVPSALVTTSTTTTTTATTTTTTTGSTRGTTTPTPGGSRGIHNTHSSTVASDLAEISGSTILARQYPWLAAGGDSTSINANSNAPVTRLLAMNPTSTAYKIRDPQVGSASVASAASSGVPPVLMMLLPASAVRWGRSWDDAVQDPFADLLHEQHSSTFTNQSGDASSADENSEDSSGVWVEIGCSVFKAQLVRNVTLS